MPNLSFPAQDAWKAYARNIEIKKCQLQEKRKKRFAVLLVICIASYCR